MSKNNLCVLVGPIFTRREYVADKEINDVIFFNWVNLASAWVAFCVLAKG